jgi:gluconokinase
MMFDSSARAIDGLETQIKYQMRTTADGGVQADADELMRYVEHAIDDLLTRAREIGMPVAAVASASLVSNVVGVDESGNAVTPVYVYADSRGSPQVEELRARFDEETVHQRVGTPFHTSYLPARLLWLEQQGRIPPEARYWMSLGEYLLWRWTGERACSYSIASWTGLLDRNRLTWDAELLGAMPIRAEQLSPLVDHDHAVGALRAEYAARWPALAAAKWFPTLGDGAAANIGSGCLDATRAALTIGTSSAIRVTMPRDAHSKNSVTVPRGLWSYRISASRELVGGALSEGGSLFAWMENALRLDDVSKMESELGALEPDGHGLTVLPFLAGERAPGWVPTARGAIVGLSLDTRPIDILRAGLEAIAFRLALIFRLVHQAAPNAGEVVASGGALAKSPVWTQIIADAVGMPVAASAEPEATSRGAALAALQALGRRLDDLPARLGPVYRPDPARHTVYLTAIERQKKLYNALVKEENQNLEQTRD